MDDNEFDSTVAERKVPRVLSVLKGKNQRLNG